MLVWSGWVGWFDRSNRGVCGISIARTANNNNGQRFNSTTMASRSYFFVDWDEGRKHIASTPNRLLQPIPSIRFRCFFYSLLLFLFFPPLLLLLACITHSDRGRALSLPSSSTPINLLPTPPPPPKWHHHPPPPLQATPLADPNPQTHLRIPLRDGRQVRVDLLQRERAEAAPHALHDAHLHLGAPEVRREDRLERHDGELHDARGLEGGEVGDLGDVMVFGQT